jgi:hypothetical protein
MEDPGRHCRRGTWPRNSVTAHQAQSSPELARVAPKFGRLCAALPSSRSIGGGCARGGGQGSLRRRTIKFRNLKSERDLAGGGYGCLWGGDENREIQTDTYPRLIISARDRCGRARPRVHVSWRVGPSLFPTRVRFFKWTRWYPRVAEVYLIQNLFKDVCTINIMFCKTICCTKHVAKLW